MRAFHGTNSKFQKFDYNFMNRMDYGYGFYFTVSKEYAKDYGKYLLTCEIPDEKYYLDFDMSWETSSKEVQYNLMDLYIHYPDQEGKRKLEKYMFSETLNSGFFILEILSKLLKGQRNAVDYLRKYNIKGLYSFKGDCYVVFNPEDIKILKTEINENLSLKYLNNQLEGCLEEMGYDGIVIPEQIHLIDDITETLQPVDRHTYVIDDTEQLVKHLKRKGLAQRIVYDKNKNWYLVSSNDQLTHPLIIEQVYNDGFYGFDVNIYQYIDKGYIREKGSNTQKPVYLYNFLYTPNTEIFTNFFDGIDHAYSYDDFGCIYTKGFDITEIPLGENLKEPQQIKENYMTELQELLEKLNKFVIEPSDKSFDEMEDETGMNKVQEEFKIGDIDINEEASFSALGTAPTPGVKVNGNPVQGQSVKKKAKKDETVIDLSLDDIIEAVEDTFNPQDVLVTEIKNNREHIRVQVGYTNPEDNLLTHTILLMYLDEAGDVLDTQQEEDLSIQDTVEELQYLKRNHTQVEVIFESDVRKINKMIESYIKE